MFFEFGGHISQNLFWNTWRERIATLKQMGPNLFNLTGSSPFSSTDVIPDEEEVSVTIHRVPECYNLSDLESRSYPADLESRAYPMSDGVTDNYKHLRSKFTDIIGTASSYALSDSEYQHQMELQSYYQSLSITNTYSCGCNTSW